MRYLHSKGFIPYQEMHRWHCTCSACSLDSGYPLHAQTDSSCSGEVITTILHHDPSDGRYFGDLFTTMQDAALAVDAEPGLQAGMHVHVAPDLLRTRDKRADALWAFIRNEPLFQRIAAGLWSSQRNNNDRLRVLHAYDVEDSIGHRWGCSGDAGFAQVEDTLTSTQLRALKRRVLENHAHADRHSNLCIATGHGTWEFRLWNSTRAAWRMELFTRLSVALVDPDVVQRLLTLPIGHSHDHVDRLAVLLDSAGHEECAVLLDRQNTYSQASLTPTSLTTY